MTIMVGCLAQGVQAWHKSSSWEFTHNPQRAGIEENLGLMLTFGTSKDNSSDRPPPKGQTHYSSQAVLPTSD